MLLAALLTYTLLLGTKLHSDNSIVSIPSVVIVATGVFYLLLQVLMKGYYQQSRRQAKFLSDASHELRTPLTIMRTELEVSLKHSQSIRQSRRSHKAVLEEVVRMQTIIDELLTMSRLEAGYKPEVTAINIAGLIEALKTSMSSFAKAKGVSLHLSNNLFKTRQNVCGSEEQLTQAFRNLLKNAIEFSKPEGGSIKLSLSEGRWSDAGMVVIKVVDEGIGIDPKDMPNIFTRFYQVDKMHTFGEGAGSGLGLSISYWIIRGSGGDLVISSKLGVGTTATVRLPLL